jgi:hypothetical protein
MDENLAIRLSRENLDIGAIRRYESPVPLFGSGAEAAEHGKRNIANPSPAAREKVAQLMRLRGRTA